MTYLLGSSDRAGIDRVRAFPGQGLDLSNSNIAFFLEQIYQRHDLPLYPARRPVIISAGR